MMSGEDNSHVHLVSAEINNHSSDTEQGAADPANQQELAGSLAAADDPVSQGSRQAADQTEDSEDCDEEVGNKSADSRNLDAGGTSSHDERTDGQSSVEQKADSVMKNDETQKMGHGDAPKNAALPDVVHQNTGHATKQGDSSHGDSRNAGEELQTEGEENELEKLLPVGQSNGAISQHKDEKDGSIHDEEEIEDLLEDGRMENLTNSILNLDGKAAAGMHFDSVPYTRHRGIKKYSTSLKTFLPVRPAMPKNVLPISHQGCINFMTYGWLTPIIWKMLKQGESTLNAYKLCEHDAAEMNAHRLEQLWDEELAKKGPKEASFRNVVLKAFRTRLICTLVFVILFLTFSLLNPIYLIRSLLEYLSKGDSDVMKGVAFVVGMGLCEILRALSIAASWFISYQSGLRLRAATMTLLFKKILNIKNLKDKSAGQLVNLVGNDSQRIFEAIAVGPLILAGPMAMLGGCSCAVYYLGPWALVGCAVFVSFYPFNTIISRITTYFRRKGILLTDKRVRMMNELLSCIKLIKMYAWEKPFAKQIETIRQQERRILEASAIVQSISTSTATMVPSIASTLTFIAMTSAGNDLDAAKAFSFVALLNSMRFVLAVLPYAVKALSEVSIAFSRYTEVMLMPEMESRSEGLMPPKDIAIEVKDATFDWGSVLDVLSQEPDKKKKSAQKEANGKKKNGGEKKPKDEKQKIMKDEATNPMMPDAGSEQATLSDITFSLPKGKLVGVCGSVGSGKSSLIQAILGRLEKVSGTVAVGGSIAYVPQQAWIMNASARENILLGSAFKQERYDSVVEACALQSDFESMVAGDMTEIGERGINLSGGQKQRISLARALYSDSDIYLLDDPLSAVDIHVGRHIFTRCISGAMAGKSIIFVTHQLQYLPQCDDIIFLKDGRILERGHHDNLMKQNGEYAALMQMYYMEQAMETEVEENADTIQGRPSLERTLSGTGSLAGSHGGDSLNVLIQRALSVTSKISTTDIHKLGPSGDEAQKPGGQLIAPEESKKGGVDLRVMLDYMKAAGGYCACLLVFLIFIVFVIIQNSSSVFLSEWLQQGSGNTSIQVGNKTVISRSVTDHPNLSTYLLIYGMLIIAMIVFLIIKAVSFMKLTLHASSTMHDNVFQKILTFPMAFFDSTPLGRIVNRFSSDMDEVDVRLPMTAEVFLSNILHVICTLILIVYVTHWFLVALIPLFIGFLIILRIFKQTVRKLKMVDQQTKSPLISHLTASVQGITTIHAYSRTSQFLKKYCDLLNTNSIPFIMFHFCTRWLAIRLELISCVVTLSTGLIIVLAGSGISPDMAGLALSSALQMTGLFQFSVRLAVETEARFTSVDRILEYAKTVSSEAASIIPGSRPSEGWPKNGSIVFSKVKMRYRESLPLTLKGVSFKVKPQEKVGIVGRTGSGKSTLGVVLFRLVELAGGSISIDDLNISTIGLEDLRSKLAIIPQDPVLFIGTVRYNLDPFNSHSDDQLWAALAKCHIKDSIAALELQLEAPVVENGENFSVGERQLLCMARALLRHSKILMLDEATAAIDTETDALVQATLREAFWDCTMLIIAHRLNTVLTCDKILVMDDGNVVEFDRPSVLMSKTDSVFRSMLEASEGSGLA